MFSTGKSAGYSIKSGAGATKDKFNETTIKAADRIVKGVKSTKKAIWIMD